MDNSIVLARIIGPILIVIALGMIINIRKYRNLIEEFTKNIALTFTLGIITLLFGLLIIQFHNVWQFRWPLIITILGWAQVIKGSVLILLPGRMYATSQYFMNRTSLVLAWSIIVTALGILLTVLGYVC
jgi:vacuolar-type H+-ATPase subunit I/STV1